MVKIKGPSLANHTSGEVIKPGFVESPTPSRVFRRKKDTSVWHWHPDCSNWPSSDFITSRAKPTQVEGNLCEECNKLHE